MKYHPRFDVLGAAAIAIAFPVTPSLAQPAPVAVNEPIVDEYGLERKSGRMAISLPEQISVGGEGPASIKMSYSWVDGAGLDRSNIPRIKIEDFYDVEHEIYWVVYGIQYGGISENFRQQRPQGGGAPTGDIIPEHPTGSSLADSGTAYVFTDKHGLKITFAGSLIDVEYPDGRTLKFENYFDSSSGTLRSTEVIRNNFGYAIKYENVLALQTTGDASSQGQALNLAETACSLQSLTLCVQSPATARRSLMVYNNTFSQHGEIKTIVMTDAAGQEVRFRYTNYVAYNYAPTCYFNGFSLDCPPVPTSVRSYPKGVTMPGDASEYITVDYAASPQFNSTGITHDDIRVSRIVQNGVTVDYSHELYTVGSPGATISKAPSFLRSSSFIGGAQISYSETYRPFGEWGARRSAMLYVRDALNRATGFNRNDLLEVSGIINPEGDGFTHQYDARRNVIQTVYNAKSNSSEPAQQESYTYAASCSAATLATCNLPLSFTDKRGKTTNFTYNSRGQVLTETRPAPTPGAPRPLVTYTYTMRTAYIKDASGAIVAAGLPISLLTQTTACISQSSCAGSVDEVITYYDYGPTTGLNNLNLRGTGVRAVNDQGQFETLWTCYQYNYFGEKIAETQPMAGLASCPA